MKKMTNLTLLETVIFWLMLLCWAISCGFAAHQQRYLDAFTFFIGGIVLLQYRRDSETARELTRQLEEKGDSFVKAAHDDDGVTVVAGGSNGEIAECCCSLFAFFGRFAAKAAIDEDTKIAGMFNDAFDETIKAYCKEKGLDRDEFAKRVGLNKLD